MTLHHIEYSSNNSGGGWWLDDEDWYNLEKNGWRVCWKKDDPDPLFKGHLEENGNRWLGALATYACKDFEAEKPEWARTLAEEDFQRITRQDPYEEGCTTCGPPHNFYETRAASNCMHTYYYPEGK